MGAMALNASKFTFKSLRSDAEFMEEESAPTGLSPWTDNKREVRGEKGNGGATRIIGWVLVPCCLCGFLLFAILGVAAVTVTMWARLSSDRSRPFALPL